MRAHIFVEFHHIAVIHFLVSMPAVQGSIHLCKHDLNPLQGSIPSHLLCYVASCRSIGIRILRNRPDHLLQLTPKVRHGIPGMRHNTSPELPAHIKKLTGAEFTVPSGHPGHQYAQNRIPSTQTQTCGVRIPYDGTLPSRYRGVRASRHRRAS